MHHFPASHPIWWVRLDTWMTQNGDTCLAAALCFPWTHFCIGWRTYSFFSWPWPSILLHAFHSVVRAMMATMTMARGHYELYISSDYDIYIREYLVTESDLLSTTNYLLIMYTMKLYIMINNWHLFNGPVRFAEKPWLKVLFAEFLWEKNTVHLLKQYGS